MDDLFHQLGITLGQLSLGQIDIVLHPDPDVEALANRHSQNGELLRAGSDYTELSALGHCIFQRYHVIHGGPVAPARRVDKLNQIGAAALIHIPCIHNPLGV